MPLAPSPNAKIYDIRNFRGITKGFLIFCYEEICLFIFDSGKPFLEIQGINAQKDFAVKALKTIFKTNFFEIKNVLKKTVLEL